VTPPEPRPPFPSPLLAFGLTSLALMLWLMGAMLFFGLGGPVAVAMGSIVGLGVLGSAAARLVPPPSDVRLGLRGPELHWLLPALLLLPLVLWTSELDNWIAVWTARPPRPDEAGPSSLAWLETGIVSVLLLPLLEEFFFRGLLLQGVAQSMRPLGACVFVGALSAIFGAAAFGTSPETVSVLAIGWVNGTLLGVLRLASGSLFVPIAWHSATAALGLLGVILATDVPVPGFNAPGDHTPASWLVTAGLPVAIGLVLLRQRWNARDPLPALPPREDEEEDERPFF